MLCALPRQSFGALEVYVSNDGEMLGESHAALHFSDGAMVSSLWPTRVPRQGGVAVTVRGHGFPPAGFSLLV